MSPDVNHKSFLLYIERFYGFMIPFERCVVNILPNTLKSTERKSEWLLHDIKNAGAEPGMIELIDEHAFDDFATDKAKAIGAAYVLEGSTLGGVVINKHLQEKLRAEIPFESRFFKGYGLETGSSWRAFLENLSASVTEQNSTSIIEGAQTNFQFTERLVQIGAECLIAT